MEIAQQAKARGYVYHEKGAYVQQKKMQGKKGRTQGWEREKVVGDREGEREYVYVSMEGYIIG